ncbi:hypothetical protein BDD12DRAFT_493474 [Trichophaea hybrida]|nr:hypothetical protein BDD12DRAFT_493474 [Trichophaea hybrida]
MEQPQPPSTVSSPPYSPPPAFPNDVTDPVPSVRDPSPPVGRYHCRVCRLYNSNEGDVCKNCIPSRGESNLSRLPVEINNHRSPAAFPTGLGIHLGSPPAPKQERAMPVTNHSFAIPNRPSQRQFSELRYEKARVPVPLPPVVMPERRFERMPEQPKRVKTRHELVAEKYKMKPSNSFGLQRPKPTEPSAQVPRPEHRPEHKSVARVTERRLLPDREPPRAARKTAFVGTARSTSTTSSKQPSPKPGSSERRSISNQPSIGPRRPSEESPRPILSARKTAPPLRRGPALKKAGRMLRETYSSDSEDSDEDEAVKAERKRYEQQKKYTKMHMGRASKISRELERERNEKAQLEEQVQKLKEQLRAMGAKEKSDQSVRKKDIYQDWDFSNEEAFPLLPQPEAPPSPEPSPTYRPREKSWQKSTYVPWDPARLMNLHLHRQRTPSHPPVTGLAAKIVEPEKSEPCATIDGSDDTTTVRVTCKEATTFDEYMGIPKDAIPLVKDASLGFKAGVIVSFASSFPKTPDEERLIKKPEP